MAGLPGEPLRPARKSGKRRWNEYKPRQVAGQGKKTEYRIQEAGDRRGNLQSQARFLGFARNDKKQSVVCRVRYFAPFNMPQKKIGANHRTLPIHAIRDTNDAIRTKIRVNS